ncbi:MAG: ABC transporter ATP-binding protein [Chromatiaceae bacterium]|jgi:putative ABC transport system ATP-binding protein|nr:ABC transporter ATP-binding protein [Chromatiaceae bacterium]
MIELDDVRKAFNQGRPNELWAVRGVSLNLPLKGLHVLKGPSGSGKTTLLAMIGCLSRPTAGRIRLDGRLISNLPERFMTEVRRATFGFVFQQFNLIRGLSVLDNVMLPAYPLAPDAGELRRRALALLGRFGIAARAAHKAEWLSGGEAQRAAVCRAMINDPRILIADEPTANLDSQRSQELLAVLGELVAMGKTVLVSSHDPLVFESAGVSHVVELHDGRLLGGGSC